jgi:hypothetical protein
MSVNPHRKWNITGLFPQVNSLVRQLRIFSGVIRRGLEIVLEIVLEIILGAVPWR